MQIQSTHAARRGRPEPASRRVISAVPAGVLVSAGIAMFALYIFMDVVASLAYDGYSYRDQTISELSAIRAPTRGFWLAFSLVYQVLVFAFAFGVLRIAEGQLVRTVGRVLMALAVVNLLWFVAPMHQREVLAADGGNWQDTMHLFVGGATSALFFVAIGVGAFVFGRGFRVFSFVTLAAMLVFGGLMASQTGGVSENEATEWLGIYERITVEGAILWQAVFAGMLLWRSAR